LKRAQESRRSYQTRVTFVMCVQQGASWQMAAEVAGIHISQSTAYRLCQTVRERGEEALQDKRQGHPSKLRGEARAFLEASCREAPSTPSSILQVALRESFDLRVSVSQINRVRATLGVSNHVKRSPQEKKGEKQRIPRHSQSGKKE
jgi:transposase